LFRADFRYFASLPPREGPVPSVLAGEPTELAASIASAVVTAKQITSGGSGGTVSGYETSQKTSLVAVVAPREKARGSATASVSVSEQQQQQQQQQRQQESFTHEPQHSDRFSAFLVEKQRQQQAHVQSMEAAAQLERSTDTAFAESKEAGDGSYVANSANTAAPMRSHSPEHSSFRVPPSSSSSSKSYMERKEEERKYHKEYVQNVFYPSCAGLYPRFSQSLRNHQQQHGLPSPSPSPSPLAPLDPMALYQSVPFAEELRLQEERLRRLSQPIGGRPAGLHSYNAGPRPSKGGIYSTLYGGRDIPTFSPLAFVTGTGVGAGVRHSLNAYSDSSQAQAQGHDAHVPPLTGGRAGSAGAHAYARSLARSLDTSSSSYSGTAGVPSWATYRYG
jgi:hypothetical protein